MHRIAQTKERWGKPPARTTMHQEIVCLRQILKTALRHQWLTALPDLSEPYRKNGKISHRAWFSRRNTENSMRPPGRGPASPRIISIGGGSEQMHDLILFMANTGLRPDEAMRLEYRDVTVAFDEGTQKASWKSRCAASAAVGSCKSMQMPCDALHRLKKRNKPATDRPLFPQVPPRDCSTASWTKKA